MTPDALDPYRAGSTEPWTVAILTALITATKPTVILETGTFEGLTTKALAEAAPLATVWTVEKDPERWAVAQATLQRWPGIRVVQDDALAFIQSLPEASVDFAFLDDHHEAAHVHQELTALKPKMRAKGFITLHDVYGPFGLDAVVAAHHGFVLDLPKLHPAGGLGLWQNR